MLKGNWKSVKQILQLAHDMRFGESPFVPDSSPNGECALIARRWAIVRLVFGLAQTIGASAGVYFLVQTGVSRWTIWAVSLTGVVSLTSIVLFRILRKGGPSKAATKDRPRK